MPGEETPCGAAIAPAPEAPLTLEQRLKAAVYMVGNNDTPQDVAAWWKMFRQVHREAAQDPDIQKYADQMYWEAEASA